jgi:hypothetical protein
MELCWARHCTRVHWKSIQFTMGAIEAVRDFILGPNLLQDIEPNEDAGLYE